MPPEHYLFFDEARLACGGESFRFCGGAVIEWEAPTPGRKQFIRGSRLPGHLGLAPASDEPDGSGDSSSVCRWTAGKLRRSVASKTNSCLSGGSRSEASFSPRLGL